MLSPKRWGRISNTNAPAPYRPQTNGKVERFNRTMLEEWAYIRPYRSEMGPLRAVLQRAHHFVKADQEDASTASWHFADQYVEKIHFLQDLNS